jgi:hypothetical protein
MHGGGYHGGTHHPPGGGSDVPDSPDIPPEKVEGCRKAIGLGMIVLVSSILMIVWVAARQRGSGGAGGAGSRTR